MLILDVSATAVFDEIPSGPPGCFLTERPPVSLFANIMLWFAL